MNDETKDLTYEEAMHGVQAGVAWEISRGSNRAHEPKHLRVGINSAMVNDEAIARLLIAKGIFTEVEYLEAIRLAAIAELDRYEARAAACLQKKVSFR